MIRDLSETLLTILDDPALGPNFPELLAANVVFERPDSTFTPQAPASINLFLFDIRENLELRNNEPIVERHNGVARTIPPPRRIDCSYLLTAWPTGGAGPLELEEHRLLAQALQVLSGYPTIPPIFLQGSLAGQEPPLPLLAPQIDGLKNSAEFWSAMGTQLRAAFTVTATISVPYLDDVSGPIVTTKRVGFDVGAGVEETFIQIGGRVLDGGGNGIPNAFVDILDAGLNVSQRARTDDEGRYTFVRVPQGNLNVRAAARGFQPHTQIVPVPGRSEDYEFTLSP